MPDYPLRADQAAADHMVPDDPPCHPGKDGLVCAGTDVALRRVLQHGVSGEAEDHAGDEGKGRRQAAGRTRPVGRCLLRRRVPWPQTGKAM